MSGPVDFETQSWYDIEVNVTDGGSPLRWVTETCRIYILDANDIKPVLDLDSTDNTSVDYRTTYVEGNDSVLITSKNVELSDIDTVPVDVNWVRAVLTNTADGANEYLIIRSPPPSPIVVQGNGTPHDHLGGPSQPKQLQSCHRTCRLLAQPLRSEREHQNRRVDGQRQHLHQRRARSYVAFVGVNDRPVLDVGGQGSGLDFTTVYTDNDGTATLPITEQALGGGVIIHDIDNMMMSSAWIHLYNTPDGPSEFLIASRVITGITITGNGTKTINLDGVAPIASYQQMFQLLRYMNTENEPNPHATRVVNFTVTDAGHHDNVSAPALTSEVAQMWISIRLDNDLNPVFQGAPFWADVREDALVGFQPLQIIALDADKYFNTSIKYSIVETETTWAIDPDSGNITLLLPVDYEAIQNYSFTVQANDQGASIGFSDRTATANVLISIVDLNDNSPVFEPNVSSLAVSVAENVAVSHVLLDLNATDADDGFNALLNYTILSGNSEQKFSLNAADGKLTIAASLDRETTASYTLRVVVCDSNCMAGFRAAYIDVIVTVTDVNDVTPIFDPSQFTSTLAENTALNSEVPLLVQAEAWQAGSK